MTTLPKHGISALPEEERPRERLLAQGAGALTNAELVAIILRTGVAGKSAIAMAHDLLRQFGSLREMLEAPAAMLTEVKGLKKAKAAQLMAAIELARRMQKSERKDRHCFTSTKAARDYCWQQLYGLGAEQFRVLLLNRQNVLLEDFLVAEGDTAEVAVSLRRIVARALQVNASALIAAHNHPSGKTTPSAADKQLTKELIEATRLLNIRVLDHIIVGDDTHSFADTGALEALAAGGASSFTDAARTGKRRRAAD